MKNPEYAALLQSYRENKLLDVVEPDAESAAMYIDEAKYSMELAARVFGDGRLAWASMAAYQAECYYMRAFLDKVGVSCGNESSSIAAVKASLGPEIADVIGRHKDICADDQVAQPAVGVKDILSEARKVVRVFEKCFSSGVEGHREFFEGAVE
ncbi:hypothetical protein ACFL3V_05100 [Nanoarchaeota archaeon]